MSSTSLAERSRRSRMAVSRNRARASLSCRSLASGDDGDSKSYQRRDNLSVHEPMIVTPTNSDGTYQRDASVPPEVVLGFHHSRRKMNDTSFGTDGNASVVSEMEKSVQDDLMDDDMPMDELVHVMKRRNTESPLLSVLPENKAFTRNVRSLKIDRDMQKSYNDRRSKLVVDAADRGGGGRSAMVDDDMSSLGIEETSLARLTMAIKNKSGKRPDHLNIEEKALWDTIQSTLIGQTSEQLQKRRILERQVQESTSRLHDVRKHNQVLQEELDTTSSALIALKGHLELEKKSLVEQTRRQQFQDSAKVEKLQGKLTEMEDKYNQIKQLFDQQEEEHESAVRAIQRVMADVSMQKEAEMEDLNKQLQNLMMENEAFKNDQLALQKSRDLADLEGDANMIASQAIDDQANEMETVMADLKLLLETVEDERDVLHLELKKKCDQLATLEKELKSCKSTAENLRSRNLELEATIVARGNEVQSLEADLAAMITSIESLTKSEKRLAAENDAKDRQIVKLKRHLRSTVADDGADTAVDANRSSKSTSVSPDLVSLLRKQLEGKEKSLETSKMLLASLQDANKSLADDLRAKLKEKDELVSHLQAELHERKKTCDNLAVDLRDLQTLKADMDQFQGKIKKDAAKQKLLAKELENTVSELQAASAVHEAKTGCYTGNENGSNDEDDVDHIASILCNALMTLKMHLSSMEVERYCNDQKYNHTPSIASSDADTDIMSVSSIGGVDPLELKKQLDAIIRNDREAASKELLLQLEARNAAVQKLEESLRREKDELAIVKMQNARLKIAKQEAEAKFNAEIISLRGQCMTNMEVLTKKERELEVLRDSLVVSDGVGYISDESDEDDEDVPQLCSIAPQGYGTAHAEALATLLVHGGSGVDGNSGEVQRLQNELSKANRERERAGKDLRIEQESLANAKMIISSLEKANKTMLEDLRCRLQDSNTAIASLLDKSTENEKYSASLKAELKSLKEERDKAKADYALLAKKMKDDNLVTALRTTAKEREITLLRLAAGAQEGASKRFPADP